MKSRAQPSTTIERRVSSAQFVKVTATLSITNRKSFCNKFAELVEQNLRRSSISLKIIAIDRRKHHRLADLSEGSTFLCIILIACANGRLQGTSRALKRLKPRHDTTEKWSRRLNSPSAVSRNLFFSCDWNSLNDLSAARVESRKQTHSRLVVFLFLLLRRLLCVPIRSARVVGQHPGS